MWWGFGAGFGDWEVGGLGVGIFGVWESRWWLFIWLEEGMLVDLHSGQILSRIPSLKGAKVREIFFSTSAIILGFII